MQQLLFYWFGFLISVSAVGQTGFNIKRTSGEANHEILYAAYSPDGSYVITAGSDLNVILWNAEKGNIYRTLSGLNKIPGIAAVSSAGDKAATGGDDIIVSLWDIKTSAIIRTFEMKQGTVRAIDISPDGKQIAAAGSDGTIRIWDTESKKLLFDLKFHKSEVNALKFSHDGMTLASGGADKILVLWNAKDGSLSKSSEPRKGPIRDISFSPQGASVASCGDDSLIVTYSLPGLDPVKTFIGHEAGVQTVEFSPNGKYLLSGGYDNYIILWDSYSGQILSKSDKLEQAVTSVSFRNGKADFISAGLRSENFYTWTLYETESTASKSAVKALEEEVMTEKMAVSEEPAKIAAESPPEGRLVSAPKAKKTKPAKKYIRLEEIAVMGKPDYTKSKVYDFDDDVIDGELIRPDGEAIALRDVPVIELFSPYMVDGYAVLDRNSTYVIGRISNAEGTNVILINKKPVKLSEAGVFEYKMSLAKGGNPVDIIAVNNKGKMNQVSVSIDCTGEGVDSASLALSSDGKYYALLIGVNDYQSNDIADLDNPVKDAGKLYDILSANYTFEKENIIFLKNPALSEIITTLDGLVGKLSPYDNLLVFFAGHGYWDEKGKIGYWFPADATKNSTVNWFRNSTLRDFIGSIPSKHILLIADACFSGAIFKTRAAFNDAPQGVQKLNDLPSRKAMTSGVLQVVPDESMFMKYLFERLSANTEKFLPSEMLFSSFKTAVMNNSSNVPQYGVIQNVGDEGGDFVFIKK